MSLKDQASTMLPALEHELRRQVSRLAHSPFDAFHGMLEYHMGWTANGAAKAGSGKRLRPLLLLLVVGACGGKWLRAISAAAAVELIHNFSLIHDDIEDNSPARRGRPTLWHQNGIPMAINAGDAMFAIANQALIDTVAHQPADIVVRAAGALHKACLGLTQGQYLDMSYERRQDLRVEDYWPMIEGKTAALIAAAAEIGAILGGGEPETVERYSAFGRNLGLAFQVQDDVLGIWGEEAETGKSGQSDLVEGKNTLPILYGIARNAQFARRWAASPVAAEETQAVAQLLRDEGAYSYSLQESERLTKAALEALRSARPRGEAGAALEELALQLLGRRS